MRGDIVADPGKKNKNIILTMMRRKHQLLKQLPADTGSEEQMAQVLLQIRIPVRNVDNSKFYELLRQVNGCSEKDCVKILGCVPAGAYLMY